MNKHLSTIILAGLCTFSASAQIDNGFYHFKNAATGRYISLMDTDPANYPVNKNSGSVNMAGIRTFINYDTVAVSPSCVIFVKNLDGGKFDMAGQGSSLYEMSGKRLNISIRKYGSTYKISGSASGFTKYLSDGSPSDTDSWLMNRSEETEDWYLLPINTTDEYIGIRPEVKTADGQYWGTIFAGFNFRLVSEGMAAYYVRNAAGAGFTLEEIEDKIVPAGIPVLVKCNSSDPKTNKIEPVIGGYEFNGINWLKGIYCALLSPANHKNVTPYQPLTMRVLGLSDNGQLAFVKAKESDLFEKLYLRGNKAYLSVGSDAADVMTLGGEVGINKIVSSVIQTNDALYTLTGVRIPENVTPRPGIYIKNGQKIVIK